MKQINIVHIHTDFKFIDGTSQFENVKFNNRIILLCEKEKHKGIYEKNALYFKHNKLKDLKKIINLWVELMQLFQISCC